MTSGQRVNGGMQDASPVVSQAPEKPTCNIMVQSTKGTAERKRYDVHGGEPREPCRSAVAEYLCGRAADEYIIQYRTPR